MSLVSMPRKEVVYSVDNTRDPVEATLTFKGTCNCPLGYSIDSCVTKAEEKLTAFRKSVKKKRDENEEAEQMRRKREHVEKRREEFEEKGVLTALYGTVERKVKCAAMCTDHLLVQKRNKLRQTLLSEEVAYATEYIAMCQNAASNREEELKRRAFDLKSKLERERQEFAKQKLIEKKIQDCDQARPVLAQKNLEQVKKDQLWQIQEKYAIQESKREEEKMYYDLMIKNMNALKENEEEMAKLAWMKQKEAKLAYEEQMRWKQKKETEEQKEREKERLKLEEEIKLNKEREIKEREERIKLNAKKAADYKAYLEKEKEEKEKRRKVEEEIDNIFSKLGQMELEKEKQSKVGVKEKMKREMDAFLENCRELKRQKEIEDRKFEEMLQELNAAKSKQKEAERARLKAAREELFSNVMKGREVQIREKREKERQEEEANAREIDLLNAQIAQQKIIRDEFERRCTKQRQLYAKQLIEQMKQVEEVKKKQREEQENYLKQLKAEEEKRLEEVKEILELSKQTHPKPHPMKMIMEQNSPNYVCPFPCPN